MSKSHEMLRLPGWYSDFFRYCFYHLTCNLVIFNAKVTIDKTIALLNSLFLAHVNAFGHLH
jgi:hypothetical protein